MDISRGRGFTLIELVTVLVILGILAATVMPRMFDQQPFVTRGYADELAGSIQQAQSVAVASGCAVQFTITGSASSPSGYGALQRAAAGTCNTGGAWSTAVRRADGATLAGTTPAGVTVTPSVQFVFDPQGRISGAAPASVQIGGFTLAVDPVSGYVTVQ